MKWFYNHTKGSKGFTLIELLIVITIIGVLATLLLANFVGIRQRARDGQRKSNLRQIQAALELYRADQGSYFVASELPCNSSLENIDGTTTYMQKIPCDPLGGDYYYVSSGSTYCLRACLENTADPERDEVSSGGNNPSCSGVTSCSSTSQPKSFTLQNP